MKRELCIAALAAIMVSCGTTETRTAHAQAPAKAACEPPPATLVTRDLEVGPGRAAIPLVSALVFYTGWVYDPCAPEHKGKQFDSNVGNPVPFGFRIGAGRVIKGWDEGVVGMKEGGKRLLVIPPGMAYGEREIPDRIPANSTLVFEVSLVQLSGPGLPPPVNTMPLPLPPQNPGAQTPKQ